MSDKAPGIQAFLDNLTMATTGHVRTEKSCPLCGKPPGEFKDELSKREFDISGMCQECQDKAFSGEEDEDPGSDDNLNSNLDMMETMKKI